MVACGYRHSMLCCEHAAPPQARSAPELARGGRGAEAAEAEAPRLVASVWAWGWGRHGQLGLGGWADALTPQLLPARAFGGRRVAQLCLGGRHSLAITAEGAVFAFGRDDDGQLGLGAAGAKCIPTLLLAERGTAGQLGGEAAASGAGWAHTALLLRQPRGAAPLPQQQAAARGDGDGLPSLQAITMGTPSWREAWLEQWRAGPPVFVRGDLEGLCGQLLGTTIQFMLMPTMLGESCGFSSTLLREELLPGVGSVYLLGHLAFGLQGVALGKRTGRPATALPMGVNIVPFFACTHLLTHAPLATTPFPAGYHPIHPYLALGGGCSLQSRR